MISKWLFSLSAAVVLSPVHIAMPLVAGVLSHRVVLPLVEAIVLPLVDVLLSVVDVLCPVVARIHSHVVVSLVAGVLPLVAGIPLCLKST